MKFINRVKNAWYMLAGREITTSDRGVLEFLGIDTENTPRRAMSEVTYFTCIKTLAEAMGKMPLKLYQRTKNGIQRPDVTETLRLLSLRPNPYMSATIFWTWCEMACQHYGNAYVWIDGKFTPSGRFGGSYKIKGFYPMHPQNVTILVDDAGIFGTTGCLYYQYTNPDTGEMAVFRDSEVLHFKTWYTEDGIVGKPARDILRDVIAGASNASAYEQNLYKNGMTAKMVMQYTGTYDSDKIKQIQKKFADRLTGPQAAGKVIPIPMDFQLTPLNMSMVDADFATLRKYTALQIASAFNVKPSNLNDYSNSKYASAESEALAFLDGFSYRLKMYEEELNAKVLTPSEYRQGFFYKFNEKSILRMDSKTQSEVLKNYTQGGIYSANEARDKLDLPHVKGGDTLLINGSYVPIAQAGAAYEKGGNTGENSEN